MKKILILILILGILVSCQKYKDEKKVKDLQWKQDHIIFISILRYACAVSDIGFEWVLTFGNNQVVRIDARYAPKNLVIGTKYCIYKDTYGNIHMEKQIK